MNTGDNILFPKSKQPSAGLAKQVRFVLHLDTESRNDENQGVGSALYPIESRHTGGSSFQRETNAMDAKEAVFAKDMQVQLDAQGANGLQMKKQVQNEPNEAGGGNAMADDQDMMEDDDLKDNELLDDTRDGDWHMPDANVRAQGVHQHHQPQPPGPLIRWERFLPQRCLRVLLVENDDCTRQVVSALLRNCSYEVVAVANGQAAWRLLEDPSNHFDLVLTEVVMPCLSGIGLLTKIVGHNTCKNIPVIMMSSHDSMGIVFKCLSKGAVDFLVKPVRKNELKNLWQHVWRRCHSSSGSGSETGSQTQKAPRPNNAAEQENNTGSNDESEDASIGLNRDGSDNGSGTQSSWTKRAVEVESPQQRSEWDYSHPHNSTIAQVIQPKITTSRKEWIPLGGASAGERQAEKAFDHAMGKDLEIAVLGQKDIELECPEKKANEEAPRIEETGGNGESPSEDAAMKAADLIGAIGNQPKSDNVQIEDNLRAGAQDSCTQMKNMAFLELSLKRSHQNAKEDNEPEDRHVLRQSGGSAFTRYSTSGSQAFHPTGESCAGTSQQLKGFGSQSINLASGSLETEKTGTAGSVHVAAPIERMGSSKGSRGGTSTPVPITNQMSHSSNNQDLGSSVVGPSVQDHMFSVPRPVNEETMSALNAENPQIGKPQAVAPGIAPYETMSRVYQPLCYPSMWPGDKAQEKEVCNTQQQQHQRPRIHQTQIHHHHHHVQHVHHHHHHHKTSSQHKHTAHENAKQQERDDQATMDDVHPTNTSPDGNNGGSGSNGNGNGSVSGSNNGSNGQNGSNGGSNGQTSAAVTAGAPGCESGVAVTGCGANNADSDTGGVGKSMGAVTTSGSGSGNGVENRSAREAALTKFRQKRKERCFEKKVRYQSRKKLAEQRPRVRGQFVRQPVQEPASMGDAE